MLSWFQHDSRYQGQIFPFYWNSKVILNELNDTTRESEKIVNALELIQNLRRKMLALKSEFLVIEGNSMTVNYTAMGQSSLFQEFVQLTLALPLIDPLTMTESERKSFFLNIYNILSLHGFTLRKDREIMSMTAKLIFYATVSYRIGPFILSLNDIEHGILRGNRPGPIPFLSCQFPPNETKDDKRIRLSLPCDPRIHFAMNCGSKSCPPIAIFAPEANKLHHQLQISTSSFLENDVIVKIDPYSITISSLFKYYRHDFGNSDHEIFQWIQSHAGTELSTRLTEFLTQGSSRILYNSLS